MCSNNDDLMSEAIADAPDERFHITDEQTANWLVKKISQARAYRRRVEEWAAGEIKRAQREEWFFLNRFGRELEDWARQELAKQPRRKSLALPAGTVGIRLEPKRIDLQDEPRALAWCRINLPSAIKRTESVLRSALKEHLEQSGELPPGVEVVGGHEKFFVR